MRARFGLAVARDGPFIAFHPSLGSKPLRYAPTLTFTHSRTCRDRCATFVLRAGQKASWRTAARAVCFRHVDPERVATARIELDALAQDFSGKHLQTICGVHARLYAFAREDKHAYLFAGAFSRQVKGNGEGARAAYLLDPWNSSYWIRHHCAEGREVRFIYSFGPNQRRESTEWQAGGDDVAIIVD